MPDRSIEKCFTSLKLGTNTPIIGRAWFIIFLVSFKNCFESITSFRSSERREGGAMRKVPKNKEKEQGR